MRIVAVLSWYDESPGWLAACVAGVGRLVDEVVAVDGAYQLMPGGRPRSSADQADAVLSAAEAADVGCVLYRPRELWAGNEVEKRQACAELALTRTSSRRDWLLVVDADMHVVKLEPDIVRAELEDTDRDVATSTLIDTRDHLVDDEARVRDLARDQGLATSWTTRDRNLFRADPTLRYGPAHWTISVGVNANARRWLRGPEPDIHRSSLAPALDLNANLVYAHRRQAREAQRRFDAEGYYQRRDRYGIEAFETDAFLGELDVSGAGVRRTG